MRILVLNFRVNSLLRLSAGLALMFTCGCTSLVRPQLPGRATALPAEAFLTQRGVLTIFGGRQFTLNGYLATSVTQGHRLVITENFGGVLADVLVTPDAKVHVMKSSAAFQRQWIEQHIAADLRCVVGLGRPGECQGQWVGADRCRLQRRWYRLELQTVSVQPGPQPATLFDPRPAISP